MEGEIGKEMQNEARKCKEKMETKHERAQNAEEDLPVPANPPPPPPSAPDERTTVGRLESLRAEKRIVEVDLQRLHTRKEEISSRLIQIGGCYLTLIIGLATLEHKQCLMCILSALLALVSWAGLVIVFVWEIELWFVKSQLRNNWRGKQRLKYQWDKLKDAGAIDTELDYWFIDEKPPSKYVPIGCLITIPMVAVIGLLVGQCFWTQCKKARR